MSKNHGGKQAIGLRLASAVVGGLVLYGALRLGRRLLGSSSQLGRLLQHVGEIFDPAAGSAQDAADAETLFQAEPAGPAGPAWLPGQHRSSLYGPN